MRLGNQDAAQAGFEKLVSRYAGHGYLPYVLVEVSGEYRQVRMFTQARSAAQYLLDRYPNSEQCLWAQREVVLSDLELHDWETADTETQTLVARFAKRPDGLWAVSAIAEANGRLGRHEQARELFRFNVTNYPASDDTIWSLRGFINESIALHDDASLDAGVKKLLSEYSTSKNLPMAILHVGRTLCTANRTQASELFQYVIDNFPGHEQALFAKACQGHVYLRQGQDNEAETLYQTVLTRYANHPKLAEAVDLMAEGYYDRAVSQQRSVPKEARQDPTGPRASVPALSDSARADRAKAIEKWEIIIQRLPANPHDTPRAYQQAADSYRQLGQLDKTLAYYQEVCESWPGYEFAWHLQFMIARLYRDLARSGQVAQAQADPKIEAALMAVLQKHPDCPAAKAARDWLGQIARRQEGGQR